jgi:hypothetical protein
MTSETKLNVDGKQKNANRVFYLSIVAIVFSVISLVMSVSLLALKR